MPPDSGEPVEVIMDGAEVVGTKEAARWLGCSEATIKRICARGKRGHLKNAYQSSGFAGTWKIPASDLEKLRRRPRDL